MICVDSWQSKKFSQYCTETPSVKNEYSPIQLKAKDNSEPWNQILCYENQEKCNAMIQNKCRQRCRHNIC